jgi:hypothetical protein
LEENHISAACNKHGGEGKCIEGFRGGGGVKEREILRSRIGENNIKTDLEATGYKGDYKH